MSNRHHPDTDVILIVDDEPTNVRALNVAVSTLGKVYFASSGEEAVKLAEQIVPDIILLDIEMPGMNGYQTCEALQAIPSLKDTAIIFVTAHNELENEIKALQHGGIDFLHKPVQPQIAIAHVQTHLALKRERQNLRLAKSTLNTIINHLPAFVAYWDNSFKNVFSNDEQGRWFGLTGKTMLGMYFEQLLEQLNIQSISASARLQNAIPQVKKGESCKFDIELVAANGEALFAQAALVPTLVDDEFSGMVMLLHDITELKLMQQTLHSEKELLQVTLNSIGDAVIATDVQGIVTYMNPIAESLTGWSQKEAVGNPIHVVMPLVDATGLHELQNPIYIALQEQRVVGMALNAKLRCRDNQEFEVEDSAAPIRNSQGFVQGAIIVFHDVSEARAMAIKMTHLANHDALTNLPNRMLLQDRAERAIENAIRKNEKVAMFVLDMDNFKMINDSVGHKIGDKLLQEISKRLQQSSRGIDTVSRQGGDEFIILVPEVPRVDMLVNYVSRLLELLSSPLWADNQRYDLSCSIGISVFPDDARDSEALYRHADSAMYRAKQLGRNRFQFFSDDMEAAMLSRHKLEQNLRRALELKLFDVYYQPKMDTLKNQIIGVEALVRMKLEDGTVVSPADFIPLAEDTGLIIPLGQLVLEKALADTASWHQKGFNIAVSINISAVQFNDDNFLLTVENLLQQSNCDLRSIEFEITESVLAKDPSRTKQHLDQLKRLGLDISIDDFGTGYSSLAYLKGFPIDTLKIDQSFVRDMLTDSSDAAIVDAIIILSKALNLKLVAEGAETELHVQALQAKGCSVVQGYFYSRPLPYAEITTFIANHMGK